VAVDLGLELANVEHDVGELFPWVGFVVTTLIGTNRAVVRSYNFGNLPRRLVLPVAIQSWSLTSLQQRLSGPTRGSSDMPGTSLCTTR
jgi:hypothetical protein